jgi:hypothetical protein
MSQRYLIALYQQFLQYNYIIDFKHFTFASSNSNVELKQVVEAKFINQLQRKIYSYDHIYS